MEYPNSEASDLEATLENNMVTAWQAENRTSTPICGYAPLGVSSSPDDVVHTPLFSHSWSKDHHDSSPMAYLYLYNDFLPTRSGD